MPEQQQIDNVVYWINASRVLARQVMGLCVRGTHACPAAGTCMSALTAASVRGAVTAAAGCSNTHAQPPCVCGRTCVRRTTPACGHVAATARTSFLRDTLKYTVIKVGASLRASACSQARLARLWHHHTTQTDAAAPPHNTHQAVFNGPGGLQRDVHGDPSRGAAAAAALQRHAAPAAAGGRSRPRCRQHGRRDRPAADGAGERCVLVCVCVCWLGLGARVVVSWRGVGVWGVWSCMLHAAPGTSGPHTRLGGRWCHSCWHHASIMPA
jgi:hypothetical protein